MNDLDYPDDGASQWYIPAKDELKLLWENVPEALDGEFVYWLSSTEHERDSDYVWSQDVGGHAPGPRTSAPSRAAAPARAYVLCGDLSSDLFALDPVSLPAPRAPSWASATT